MNRRPNLSARLFTGAERAYADRRHDPSERYAVRFAAKEAVLKAMGLGLGGCRFIDIEVVKLASGAPGVQLHGQAGVLAAERDITEWRLSLTHTDSVAQAIAVALGAS